MVWHFCLEPMVSVFFGTDFFHCRNISEHNRNDKCQFNIKHDECDKANIFDVKKSRVFMQTLLNIVLMVFFRNLTGFDKFLNSFDSNLTPYFAAIICIWGRWILSEFFQKSINTRRHIKRSLILWILETCKLETGIQLGHGKLWK